jgi:hypothetical protein
VAVRRLSWGDVWRRRLARHFLLDPAPRDRLGEVAGAVCGVHAQMMPSAEISLGLRVAGATRSDLRTELWERRSLVKTYGLRGTVHLFPTAELPLWLAALRANPEPQRSLPEERTLDPAQEKAVVEAIADALDGRPLTRDELEAEVARRVGDWALEPGLPAFGGTWPRWVPGIGAAARAGVLCFGPNRGNKVTYLRVDQWVGTSGPVDGAQALTEVLRRFLVAYGPATHREFARWFRTDERAAAAMVRSLDTEVEEVDVEGWRGWLPAADEPAPDAAGSVRLLPHFDCYVVGAHPRARFLPPVWAERGLPSGTAAQLPVLLVDGAVGGLWHRRRAGRRLEITVEPFGRLTARQRREVAAEADRVGAILEASVTVTFGPVPARPHL